MRKLTILSFVVLCFVSVNCQTEKAADKQEVKNVILLIGDGMGVAQVYAAMSVSQEKLNIERSQYYGYSKTYSLSDYTTDSGAGATAIATGTKSYNKAISVDSNKIPLKRITDYAKDKGMSTGVVATCELTHATPACFLSHSDHRYNDEIVARNITKSNADIIVAGGAIIFDTLGLYDTMLAQGYAIEPNLEKIDVNSDDPVLSLPFKKSPPSMLDGRGDFLPVATNIALQKLNSNPEGFFLMVEGSQIDWACHENNIEKLVAELIDFDQAVGVAYDFADANPGTLVIVTADHETGGLTLPNGSIQEKTVEAEFSKGDHTGVMVPVFAYGTGAEAFSSIMENTEIFYKIRSALGLFPCIKQKN